jgi:diguanylate cyclase (GGDEF)-like protein
MKDLFTINNRLWNRKIINVYWGIILIEFLSSTAGVIITYFTAPEVFMHDLLYYTLLPTAYLIMINLTAEVAWRRQFHLDYFVIAIGTLIPAVIVYIFSMMYGIQHILFVPILVSALYFERKKVLFACVLSMLTFFALYRWNDTLNASMGVFDIVLTLGIFIGCAILAMGIMTRGIHLLDYLKQSMEEKQELHIQNIMSDHLSKIDALTGLYNHKTFHEYMDRLIEQKQVNEFTLDLAVLDIDNFKLVNDTYGHWVGDLLLRKIASTISSGIGANCLSFRPGGEEFAVIYTEQAWEDVLSALDALRAAISSISIPELRGHSVTVSIGVQRYEHNMDKYTWFNLADNCLYEAKRKGKNQIVC